MNRLTLHRLTTLTLMTTLTITLATKAAAAPLELVVNDVSDAGSGACKPELCTLRDAIVTANQSRTGAVIRFALPARTSVINVTRQLPSIGSNIRIDATQSRTLCPAPSVEINGKEIREAIASGLVINGNNNQVTGIAVTNFSGHGFLISGARNQLQCSFAGISLDGFTAAGNAGDGIRLENAQETLIGSLDPSLGVYSAANQGWGVRIIDSLYTDRFNTHSGENIAGEPRLPNGEQRGTAAYEVPELEPSAVHPRLERAVTRLQGRQLSRVADFTDRSLIRSRLLHQYGRLVTPAGQPLPSDFQALLLALASQPELLERFQLDVAEALQEGEDRSASWLNRMQQRYRRITPGFGRDGAPTPADATDQIATLIGTLDPSAVVIAGNETDLVAVALADPPVGLNPFEFAQLQTYGPTPSNINFVESLGNTPLLSFTDYIDVVTRCQNSVFQCEWPIAHDFLPYSFSMTYKAQNAGVIELDNIIKEFGYQFRVRLNGQLLDRGDGPDSNNSGADYYATALPAAACPDAAPCLALTFFARRAMASEPLPWNIELEIKKSVPVPPTPVLVDNEVVIVSTGLQTFSKINTSITPNQTNQTSWFETALYPTFQSPRCTDCHGMENFAGLDAHHINSGAGGVLNLINLEPSAYVPGGNVMTCDYSCHVVPPTDDDGDPFHETEWKSPFFDLDVNWLFKNVAQTCDRVGTNLPTQDLRHEHFHEDGRLFWAIERPKVMGVTLNPPAEPTNWRQFLRRVDIWNVFGARCP